MISMARTFGAPVIDPPGKAARSRLERVRARREVADHRRDEMVNRGVVLEREELRHAHGAGRADARQVVAEQIHDHQVLGPVLGARGQRHAECGVVLRADAARPRALDGPRFDVPADVTAESARARR